MVFEDSSGEPATQEYAQEYARNYGFIFTTAYDPTRQLDAYAENDAIPMNMFIDLSTMQILDISHGIYSFETHAWDQIQLYLSSITR